LRDVSGVLLPFEEKTVTIFSTLWCAAWFGFYLCARTAWDWRTENDGSERWM